MYENARPARVVALALAWVALAIPPGSRAEMFEGFPDVLVCDGGEVGSVLFYASHRSKEGAVTYRALVKGPVTLTVTPAGDVSTDRIFCAGETVDSLRKAGRAHDLTGP